MVDSDFDEDDFDEDDLSSWPNEKTAELIQRWKAKPFLYDLTHKLYSNKPKKDAAIARIADKMNVTRE